MPVLSSHGLSTAKKDACSCPDQAARILIEPAFVLDEVPQATAVHTAGIATTSARVKLEECMFSIPHMCKPRGLPIADVHPDSTTIPAPSLTSTVTPPPL